MGSTLATLGGKRLTCLGPFLRLQSVQRGCFLVPHHDVSKRTFHNLAQPSPAQPRKAPCASFGPSGVGDEGRPMMVFPYREATGLFWYTVTIALVVNGLVRLGSILFGLTGNLHFARFKSILCRINLPSNSLLVSKLHSRKRHRDAGLVGPLPNPRVGALFFVEICGPHPKKVGRNPIVCRKFG